MSALPGRLRLLSVRDFFALVLALSGFVFVATGGAVVILARGVSAPGVGAVVALAGDITFPRAAAVRGLSRSVVGLSGAVVAFAARGLPVVISSRPVAGVAGTAVVFLGAIVVVGTDGML